jgi:hypothetical protein
MAPVVAVERVAMRDRALVEKQLAAELKRKASEDK